MTALGQPLIYMGQEYGIERERNRIDVNWEKYSEPHNFYLWARGIIRLRRYNEGFKLCGYNPAEKGRFSWVIGPWMEENCGKNKRVIGWRTNDKGDPSERLLVLFNFEGKDVTVDIDFGFGGKWVKLADMDHVNDLSEMELEDIDDKDILVTGPKFNDFHLPAYSGFVFKYIPEY